LERESDKLAFGVHDTGRGFDHRTTTRGVGLTGIQERIDTVGGHIEISGGPGRGTTATGVVPALRVAQKRELRPTFPRIGRGVQRSGSNIHGRRAGCIIRIE
jgi:signal transduction histidine kinase